MMVRRCFFFSVLLFLCLQTACFSSFEDDYYDEKERRTAKFERKKLKHQQHRNPDHHLRKKPCTLAREAKDDYSANELPAPNFVPLRSRDSVEGIQIKNLEEMMKIHVAPILLPTEYGRGGRTTHYAGPKLRVSLVLANGEQFNFDENGGVFDVRIPFTEETCGNRSPRIARLRITDASKSHYLIHNAAHSEDVPVKFEYTGESGRATLTVLCDEIVSRRKKSGRTMFFHTEAARPKGW